nr:recombinase family protein [Shinella sp. HZN7]
MTAVSSLSLRSLSLVDKGRVRFRADLVPTPKGAHLYATEQPIDTSTAAGKAFFDMLGVFAEFETNLRRERQAEGIAAARKRGTYKGRPPKIDRDPPKAEARSWPDANRP